MTSSGERVAGGRFVERALGVDEQETRQGDAAGMALIVRAELRDQALQLGPGGEDRPTLQGNLRAEAMRPSGVTPGVLEPIGDARPEARHRQPVACSISD